MKTAPRQYRNQRLFRPQRRQQHLLEVSLRASKERERRIRTVVGFLFKLMMIATLGVGAWFGTKQALRRLLWENPTFFLSDVRVTTDGTLTREQILTSGNVLEGRNILLLNAKQVQKALEALPQVQRAEVRRTLPNRVDIEIAEREPVAWVTAKGDTDPTTSDRSFLIDARGYVMKRNKKRNLPPEYNHLPSISGVETEDLVPGQKVTLIEMQSALELIRCNADNVRWQVRNIDLSKGYCMAVTDQRNFTITFGLDDVDTQLNTLYRILDEAQSRQQIIKTANLLVKRNIPVVYYDPAVEEAHAAAASTPPPATADLQKAKQDAKPKAETKEKAAASPTPAAKPTPAARRTEVASAGGSKPKEKERPSSSAKKASIDGLKKPFRLNNG